MRLENLIREDHTRAVKQWRDEWRARKHFWSVLYHYALDHKSYKDAARLALGLSFENERLRNENTLLRMSADKEVLATKFVSIDELRAKETENFRLRKQIEDWTKRYDEAFNKTLGDVEPKFGHGSSARPE